MRAFLDTEFVKTLAGPQFLSAGICLRDGRELYPERDEPTVAALAASYPSTSFRGTS
jgi:hypothetical protein